MGRPRKEYKKGQAIGLNGVIFLEELEGHETPSGAYERKILALCPICGKEFETSLRKVVRTNNATKRCQECSEKINAERIANLGKETIVDLTGQKFGKWTVLCMTDKRYMHSPVWHCICECKTERDVPGYELKRGHSKSCGCLKSSGEHLIAENLTELKIIYEKQKTFKDCLNPEHTSYLYFDFYLPDYNCCIEYDGEQHFYPVEFYGGEEKFKRQQLLDSIKNQYCIDNNIKLIRIPYTDYNKINSVYIIDLISGCGAIGDATDSKSVEA